MSLRWRILLFLAALIADSIFVRTQPWTMVIGVVAYLAFVFPAVARR